MIVRRRTGHYVLSLIFLSPFFHRVIWEDSWPVSTKLSHMLGSEYDIEKVGKKIEVLSSLKFGVQNVKIRDPISDIFRLDRLTAINSGL